MHHRWTRSDDLAAFYVARFGVDQLPYTQNEIAMRRGIGTGSFRMRIQNFESLDGRGKMDHYARQSREVYEQYRNTSESDLRRMAFPEL